MPLPASHWRVGCACHARCFSARSNLTRLLRKIPDTKSRLLAKSLDPQDLSEGSLSVVARCQVHQQRVRLAAECLTHTEVALVDGPNCVIVFTERLLLTKEQSSMLQGRWAATAAETTSGMAATSGELQPYRNRKRISTIRPRAAARQLVERATPHWSRGVHPRKAWITLRDSFPTSSHTLVRETT